MSFEYPDSWEEINADELGVEGMEFAADGPPDSKGGRPRITAIREEASRPAIRLRRSACTGRRSPGPAPSSSMRAGPP
jgi:hypothetical protein